MSNKVRIIGKIMIRRKECDMARRSNWRRRTKESRIAGAVPRLQGCASTQEEGVPAT